MRIGDEKPETDLHRTRRSNAQGSTIGKIFPGGNPRSSVGRGLEARDVEILFDNHMTQWKS